MRHTQSYPRPPLAPHSGVWSSSDLHSALPQGCPLLPNPFPLSFERSVSSNREKNHVAFKCSGSWVSARSGGLVAERSLEFSGGLSPVYMVISRTFPGHFPENSGRRWKIRGQVLCLSSSITVYSFHRLHQCLIEFGYRSGRQLRAESLLSIVLLNSWIS